MKYPWANEEEISGKAQEKSRNRSWRKQTWAGRKKTQEKAHASINIYKKIGRKNEINMQ